MNIVPWFLSTLWLIVFGLQLGGAIDWSWWAVWAPLWVGAIWFLGFALGVRSAMNGEVRSLQQIADRLGMPYTPSNAEDLLRMLNWKHFQ